MVGLVEESEMHQRGYRSSRCRDQSYRAAAARKAVAASDLKGDDRDLASAPSRLRGDGNGQCRSHLLDDSYGSGSLLEDNSVSSSFDRLAEDSLTSHYVGMDSGSSVSSKEADQPSPNSVLELPSEEKSSETCFQRIGADLHELRMQLQLLKLETETYEEESDLLSDDDSRGHCQSIKQIEEGVHQFEDDADRDFSYLIDVLIVSGIRSVNQDRLFDACYLPERPVDPNVFEKLEKKYGVLTDWLKSERKLFFDHVNSVLAAILAPCMDLHPWVKSTGTTTWIRKGLAEEVLQMVVRQRKEWSKGNPEGKVLDTKWLEVTDDVDMIGREIERMMTDTLLEELVSEFVIS